MSERVTAKTSLSISVSLEFGESVYNDIYEAYYEAQNRGLHPIALSLSPRAFLSLSLYLREGRQYVFAFGSKLEIREEEFMKFDSRIATYEHIGVVRKLLMSAIQNLQSRLLTHDDSKLQSPEKEIFDEYTPKLAGCTYGSDEYKSYLEQMKPGLDHHYANNSHHPEYYKDGIREMSLLDLLEMLLDWKAATLRHNDGDINRSIEINQKRFGYSDELKAIFQNTISELNL